MASVANINDVLEGHVALEIECVDRLHLNAYVPNLQVGGQVVRFLRDHLGNQIPSPAFAGAGRQSVSPRGQGVRGRSRDPNPSAPKARPVSLG
jgi:hypothetical protein